MTIRKKIREYSDRVCLAFGIQPITQTKGSSRNLAYNEWEHKRKGTSCKDKIRLEIDRLIATVKNLYELLNEFETMGLKSNEGKTFQSGQIGNNVLSEQKHLGKITPRKASFPISVDVM